MRADRMGFSKLKLSKLAMIGASLFVFSALAVLLTRSTALIQSEAEDAKRLQQVQESVQQLVRRADAQTKDSAVTDKKNERQIASLQHQILLLQKGSNHALKTSLASAHIAVPKAVSPGGAALRPAGGSELHPTGFVRVPTIAAGPNTADDGKLHIVFSSGCNKYQQWQSELLLASAAKVGQRGRITRIVSGCYDDLQGNSDENAWEGKKVGKSNNYAQTAIPLTEHTKSTNPNFGLFMTPSFRGAKKFPWINKPSSIDYFMTHAKQELERLGETIVMILDPDFVFLAPITQSAAGSPREILQGRASAAAVWTGEGPAVNVARPGRPVAQTYGLGGEWVKEFDIPKITGDPQSPANSMTAHEAATYYSVGPPLIVHLDDMQPLAKLWVKYMHGVMEQQQSIRLESDMYAWNIASAALGLRHTLIDSFMVSDIITASTGNPGTTAREGWQWVDPLLSHDLDCNDPDAMLGKKLPPNKKLPAKQLPNFIHMAHRYVAPAESSWPDEWSFAKSHVPADILECGVPLLRAPPADLLRQSRTNKDRSRDAWMQCNIVSRLNQAALAYKLKFCPQGDFDGRKLVRLMEHRSGWGASKDNYCILEKDWRAGKQDLWCWSNAQVEGVQTEKPALVHRYSPKQRQAWADRKLEPDFTRNTEGVEPDLG